MDDNIENGELMKSNGYGWILSKIDENYILDVIINGNWFTEKKLILTEDEILLFKRDGKAFLDSFYSEIVRNSLLFEKRFVD